MNDHTYEPAQRTTLAWRRTGLSLFVVGLLTARGLPHASVQGSPVAGGVVLVLAVGLFALSARLASRRAHEVHGPRPTARMGEMAPLALGTALVGLAAFVLAVVWE